MLDKLNEIQSFIRWCTANKVKSIKIKDLEFEISDYAFVEQIQSGVESPLSTEDVLDEREMSSNVEQSQEAQEDEDLLYWSS